MDTIGDFLTQLRNASLSKMGELETNWSKIREGILRILQAQNFIKNYSVITKEKKKYLKIILIYQDHKPAISFIKRVSKPGRRVYSSWRNIRKPLGRFGLVIISTPEGLMSDSDVRSKRVGGEIICSIY